MILVTFKDVGREKKCWSAEMPDLHTKYLTKEVHGQNAILSRHPDFQMVDDDNGIILAGMRPVGTFTVKDL